MNERIDVIVPAHRAHETIGRTLESLAMQSIAGDLDVIIVDDECPEGDYRDAASSFLPRLNIKLIRLPENLGPGGARQAGIDASDNPLFTCIDADDTYAEPSSLELLRSVMTGNDAVQRCGGEIAVPDGTGKAVRQSNAWMLMCGKIFRRSFTERYGIRFNGTRANEDFGYNLAVDLICDNEAEQILNLPDVVGHVHMNPGSITNHGSFEWDQHLCGMIDNAIWAVGLAKRYRPDSDEVSRRVLQVLLIAYCCWNIIVISAPEYADQAWEYTKKYYHLCYRRWYVPAFASMEEKLKPETTKDIFNVFAREQHITLPDGHDPVLPFDEFLRRMKTEEYDPDHIYDVWAEMSKSPEMRARMEMNEESGVCRRGYAVRNGEDDV